MKLFFDNKDYVFYEICSAMPSLMKTNKKLLTQMLALYSIYRNGLYDTRITKALDADIAKFQPKFPYEYENKDRSANNHLYHYASYIGRDAMEELFKHDNGQCCVAYHKSLLNKIAVGFLVFYEKEIDNHKMLYISHVSAKERRKGIGTKLIQTVLEHYPAGTRFYLCARKSNQDGLSCYQKLGFVYDHSYVKKFGYNPDYFVGMTHTTTQAELNNIKQNTNMQEVSPNLESYFSPK